MKPQDIQDLKQLIEFLKQYQVAEFDLDRGDLKIRLKFSQPARIPPSAAPRSSIHAPPPHLPPAAVTPCRRCRLKTRATGLHIVKSPIVGTYYGSPSPGAAAFVSPGDHVEKGQVICIVEAMKLMNEIESDAAGEVVKCLVSNGQPIEFGQPLFSIRLN